ncbi:MAG: FAD-linked oxidase C-terminal domain-containing protein [Ancalomicrobiaceae bacterium]|nr:FAD-linked oxidase C-terminal domain-containing protein [Ancalomicrobiaceae bacterium]
MMPADVFQASTRGPAAVFAALQARFGDRVTGNATIREQHGNALSEVPNQPPDLVVFPESTEEVAEIVRCCRAAGVPIIPFGTGTSFEGHVNAPFGGVSVDLSRLKSILAVHDVDLQCVVEAGVTREELNRSLRDRGLFFPIDPGADASLGGMAATRASGTNAVRYGTMKDNVLAMTVVLADGRIARIGGRAGKSAAGYDLVRLMVGSEGTLGIITELTLRLHGLPEQVAAGICAFPTVKAACDTVISTIQLGIPIARIELLDEVQVRACNAYSALDLPEQPLLCVEFHGSPVGVGDQIERFAEIAGEYGGGELQWAVEPERRSALWRARHNAYWAARGLRPGTKGISTDVCVPISQLAACVVATKEDAARSGIIAPIVGHVGDGNFHCLPLIDQGDPAEVANGRAFVDRLVRRALAFGGTTTGEHGIGQSNMKYLEVEFEEPALDMMRAVKRALDPDNLMNPGKIVRLSAPML